MCFALYIHTVESSCIFFRLLRLFYFSYPAYESSTFYMQTHTHIGVIISDNSTREHTPSTAMNFCRALVWHWEGIKFEKNYIMCILAIFNAVAAAGSNVFSSLLLPLVLSNCENSFYSSLSKENFENLCRLLHTQLLFFFFFLLSLRPFEVLLFCFPFVFLCTPTSGRKSGSIFNLFLVQPNNPNFNALRPAHCETTEWDETTKTNSTVKWFRSLRPRVDFFSSSSYAYTQHVRRRRWK